MVLTQLKSLIESLAEIESVKDSRSWFKRCVVDPNLTTVLPKIVPSLKKVVQTQNLEIVFENALTVTGSEWNSFVKSLKKLHPVNKVQAKFIGKKELSCNLF